MHSVKRLYYKMTVKSKVQMSSNKAQNSKFMFCVKFKQQIVKI